MIKHTNQIHLLSPAQIERIAQLLGEETTRGKISDLFASLRVTDESNESTKWRRLRRYFEKTQKDYKVGNHILSVIHKILEPSYYTGRSIITTKDRIVR